jgi:hypothetical protein
MSRPALAPARTRNVAVGAVAASAVLGLLEPACRPARTRVEVPTVSGAHTLFLVTQDPSSNVDVLAVDLDPAGTESVAVATTDQLFAVFYADTLAAFHVAAGPISASELVAGARPLPPHGQAFRHATEAWATVSSTAGVLANVEIPGLSNAACGDGGGCARLGPAGEYCEIPCDAPLWRQVVAAPAPPEHPHLGPCPSGWSETAVPGAPADLTTCAPPTSGCPFGGHDACVAAGGSCPAADFPPDAPPGAVLVGGHGCTHGAPPFCTIGEAIATASVGATILIAAGTYSEPLNLARPLTLVGVCASGTIVVPPPDPVRPVLAVSSSGARIRNLTILGGLPGGGGGCASTSPGPAVSATASLALDGVVMGCFSPGGVIEGSLSASDLALSDLSPGLEIRGAAAQVTLRRALVEGAATFGIGVEGPARLDFEEVVVRKTTDGDDPILAGWCSTYYGHAGGNGLYAHGARSVRVHASLFEDNYGDGVQTSSTASTALDALVVRGNQHGIMNCSGPSSITRVFAVGNASGIASTTGAQSVHDVVLLSNNGIGIEFTFDRASEFSRGYLADNQEYGALLQGQVGASAAVGDLDIRLTRGTKGPPELELRGSAPIHLERIAITGMNGYGVTDYDGAPTDFSDLSVSGPALEGFYVGCKACYRGRSQSCDRPAKVSATRLVIDHAGENGILIDSSLASFKDVVVAGSGQMAETAALGVTAFSKYHDPNDNCSQPQGMPATVDVEHFAFVDSPVAGVIMGGSSQLSLTNGEVSGAAIGVKLESSVSDTLQQTDVAYRGDRTNLLDPN